MWNAKSYAKCLEMRNLQENLQRRRSIQWQDCLLSLRYDRTPMHPGSTLVLQLHGEGITKPGYFECMHAINCVCRSYLVTSEAERCNALLMLEQTSKIDAVIDGAALHLKLVESCSSLQQRLELLALRMHSSFLLAEICRPFLYYSSEEARSDDVRYSLNQRGLYGMMDTVKAYIDMAGLSLLPLRSWSLTHEALTCACVLTLFRSFRSMQTVQSGIRKLYLLLEDELASEGDQAEGKWSLHQGVRLLRRLQNSQSENSSGGGNVDSARPSGLPVSTTDHVAGPPIGPQYDAVDSNTSVFFDQNGAFADDVWPESSLTGPEMSLSSLFDFSTNMFTHPEYSAS